MPKNSYDVPEEAREMLEELVRQRNEADRQIRVSLAMLRAALGVPDGYTLDADGVKFEPMALQEEEPV